MHENAVSFVRRQRNKWQKGDQMKTEKKEIYLSS